MHRKQELATKPLAKLVLIKRHQILKQVIHQQDLIMLLMKVAVAEEQLAIQARLKVWKMMAQQLFLVMHRRRQLQPINLPQK